MLARMMNSTNGPLGGTANIASRGTGLRGGIVAAVIALMAAAPAWAAGFLSVADGLVPIAENDTVDLGEFAPGDSAGIALTLRNFGDQAVQFSGAGFQILNASGVSVGDVDVNVPGNGVPVGGFGVLSFGFTMPADDVSFDLRLTGSGDNMPFTFSVSATALQVATPALQVTESLTVIDAGDTYEMGQVDPNELISVAFTVRNNGDGALVFDNPRVTAQQVSGPNGGDLAFQLGSAQVQPGGFAVLGVSFESPTAGEYEYDLTLHSNDPVNPDYTFRLAVEVLAQLEPDIQISESLELVNPGDTYDLGDIEGGATGSVAFTVRNNGEANLVYTAAKISVEEITNGDPNDLTTAFNLNGDQVAPGAFSILGVSLVPTSAGEREFDITVHSNDPDTPEYTFTITANVLEEEIDPELGTPDMQVTFELTVIEAGDAHDLGPVNIGETGSAAFTIRNLGDGDLKYEGDKLTVTEITNGDPNDLTAEIVVNADTVAPNALSILGVSFVPTSEGPREFDITLHTNDPDSPDFTFTLLAEGVENEIEPPIGTPVIEVSYDEETLADGDSFDMGEAELGDTLSATFTIRNIGDAKLEFTATPKVSLTELSAGNVADFSATLVADELNPGTSTTLAVSFTPTSLGEREVEMTIESNDPQNSPLTIVLNAAGIEEIEVDPNLAPDMRVFHNNLFVNLGDTVTLDPTAEGTSTGTAMLITNVGEATLALTGDPVVRFEGVGTKDASEFSATVNATQIAPGSAAIMTVEFNPAAAGARTMRVIIESNDPAALEYDIIISASAFADCNENGADDAKDVEAGRSDDCNENGTPDECETDGDNDGVIDDCDRCPGADDARDSDGDSVADCLDNCPNQANTQQVDSNNDGVGDACEDVINPGQPGQPGQPGGDSRFCGAGAAGLLPAMMLGMVGARSTRRRKACTTA